MSSNDVQSLAAESGRQNDVVGVDRGDGVRAGCWRGKCESLDEDAKTRRTSPGRRYGKATLGVPRASSWSVQEVE